MISILQFQLLLTKMTNNHLAPLGWNTFFEQQLSSDHSQFIIGRVAVQNKTNYEVFTPNQEYVAEATGKLYYMAQTDSELPKVGDWVLMTETDHQRAIIHQVLKRKSVISRKVPGKKTEEQVIAANVDRLFIVQGLDDNFNIARLERYLTLAINAEPVIVLNKADLCPNPEEIVADVKSRIQNVPIVLVKAAFNEVDALRPFVTAGSTVAVVGSSGVGKSTIINQLLGQSHLPTGEVRSIDSKGRHTTTRRELVILPGGGILVDTPGMRELQLWGDSETLGSAFGEIEDLISECKFADCTHTREKGCAVLQALEAGELPHEQWNNFVKMKKELHYLETKTDLNAMLEKKNKWKKIHKDQKQMYKSRSK